MKRLITLLLLALSCSGISQSLRTMEEKELNIKAPGTDGVLAVLNINGQVKVTGTDRSDIFIRYDLKVRPHTDDSWSQAQKELSLDVGRSGDSVFVALNGPFVQYRNGRRHVNYNSDFLGYWFDCDIEVEVPKNINLRAATVNDGNVKIENIKGDVVADNVNGGLSLQEVNGKVFAETVNGDIEVNFTGNPGDGSHFQSVNGNIKTVVPSSLSATIAFKSMNGEFFTDFPYSLGEGGKVLKNDSKRDGTSYRIEQLTNVTVGRGQASLYYETLNGDMYLRKLN